eukprot:5450839-Prymnesium_polylepis.1
MRGALCRRFGLPVVLSCWLSFSSSSSASAPEAAEVMDTRREAASPPAEPTASRELRARRGRGARA